MSAPKISAIAPWFGSKRTLAPRIVEQLGPHRCYWEPFGGSLAVLLAKPTCSQETVNDLHGDVINLARTIAHPAEGPRLYRRLRRTLVCEQSFHEAAAKCKARRLDRSPADALDPDAAFDYFVASWLGRNGVSGTESYNQGFAVRYTASTGGVQGTRFANAVRSIPAWRRRLREVTILNRDAFVLLEAIEDEPVTAIYCDPPYLAKGSKYVHDFRPGDHRRLADALGRFRLARVVVSYYDHADLAGLYPGWTLIRCEVAKAMVQSGRRNATGRVLAPEVLLVNGPAFGRGSADLFGGQS